jgi:hypothetical protein
MQVVIINLSHHHISDRASRPVAVGFLSWGQMAVRDKIPLFWICTDSNPVTPPIPTPPASYGTGYFRGFSKWKKLTLLLLQINFFFFVNIVRVLFSKLVAPRRERSDTGKFSVGLREVLVVLARWHHCHILQSSRNKSSNNVKPYSCFETITVCFQKRKLIIENAGVKLQCTWMCCF